MDTQVDHQESTQANYNPRCEVCGEPARVHISNEQADGTRLRHLCLQCAAKVDDIVPRNQLLNVAAILLVVGAFILMLSLFADILALGQHDGFGWQQQLGLTLAAILVMTAAVMQTPTVLVIGLMIGSITILADRLGLGSSSGFGVKQITGSALGVILIVAGWLMAKQK